MENPRMIYLLRHGAIDPHYEGKLIGQMNVPLGELGLRQAQWWKWQWAKISFQRILCSDLIRSRQTAEIVATQPQPPVEVVPELRELSLGHWEGLTAKTVKARFPDEWTRRGLDFENCPAGQGESFADLAARAVPAFQAVADNCEGPVLIVGHGGTNRVILCHVLGIPLQNLFRFRQDYCALNIIEPSAYAPVVHLINRRPEDL